MMESFYGGRQGNPFVIKYTFDAVTLDKYNTIECALATERNKQTIINKYGISSITVGKNIDSHGNYRSLDTDRTTFIIERKDGTIGSEMSKNINTQGINKYGDSVKILNLIKSNGKTQAGYEYCIIVKNDKNANDYDWGTIYRDGGYVNGWRTFANGTSNQFKFKVSTESNENKYAKEYYAVASIADATYMNTTKSSIVDRGKRVKSGNWIVVKNKSKTLSGKEMDTDAYVQVDLYQADKNDTSKRTKYSGSGYLIKKTDKNRNLFKWSEMNVSTSFHKSWNLDGNSNNIYFKQLSSKKAVAMNTFLEDDKNLDKVNYGDYVLIDTNKNLHIQNSDNGKIYRRGYSGMEYVGQISGSTGGSNPIKFVKFSELDSSNSQKLDITNTKASKKDKTIQVRYQNCEDGFSKVGVKIPTPTFDFQASGKMPVTNTSKIIDEVKQDGLYCTVKLNAYRAQHPDDIEAIDIKPCWCRIGSVLRDANLNEYKDILNKTKKTIKKHRISYDADGKAYIKLDSALNVYQNKTLKKIKTFYFKSSDLIGSAIYYQIRNYDNGSSTGKKAPWQCIGELENQFTMKIFKNFKTVEDMEKSVGKFSAKTQKSLADLQLPDKEGWFLSVAGKYIYYYDYGTKKWIKWTFSTSDLLMSNGTTLDQKISSINSTVNKLQTTIDDLGVSDSIKYTAYKNRQIYSNGPLVDNYKLMESVAAQAKKYGEKEYKNKNGSVLKNTSNEGKCAVPTSKSDYTNWSKFNTYLNNRRTYLKSVAQTSEKTVNTKMDSGSQKNYIQFMSLHETFKDYYKDYIADYDGDGIKGYADNNQIPFKSIADLQNAIKGNEWKNIYPGMYIDTLLSETICKITLVDPLSSSSGKAQPKKTYTVTFPTQRIRWIVMDLDTYYNQGGGWTQGDTMLNQHHLILMPKEHLQAKTTWSTTTGTGASKKTTTETYNGIPMYFPKNNHNSNCGTVGEGYSNSLVNAVLNCSTFIKALKKSFSGIDCIKAKKYIMPSCNTQNLNYNDVKLTYTVTTDKNVYVKLPTPFQVYGDRSYLIDRREDYEFSQFSAFQLNPGLLFKTTDLPTNKNLKMAQPQSWWLAARSDNNHYLTVGYYGQLMPLDPKNYKTEGYKRGIVPFIIFG